MARRNRRRRWLLFAIAFALLPGLLVLVTARAWSVTAPPPPENPGVVYIADYGRHSRLALQVDDDRMLEYAFGDWRYYALGESTLWRGAVALIVPTDAGFGRRALAFVDDEATFNRRGGAVRSRRVEVERAKLDELLSELDARYQESIATEIEADWGDFTFVKDDRSYRFFHNSNHETAGWLRTLGCEIRGSPILSNFRVRKAN